MLCLKDGTQIVNAQEWEIKEDAILKPFEAMTTELSGKDYPILGIVIPLVGVE